MTNRTKRQKHAILALTFLTAPGLVSAQEQPQRIVSIVPALTEALFAMREQFYKSSKEMTRART